MIINPDEVCCLAQNLARNAGWAVFPCSLPKKLPTIPKDRGGNGFHDATTQPDRIADLWRRGFGDLIGIATGKVSGVDVLDVDVQTRECHQVVGRRIQAHSPDPDLSNWRRWISYLLPARIGCEKTPSQSWPMASIRVATVDTPSTGLPLAKTASAMPQFHRGHHGF